MVGCAEETGYCTNALGWEEEPSNWQMTAQLCFGNLVCSPTKYLAHRFWCKWWFNILKQARKWNTLRENFDRHSFNESECPVT